MAQPRKANKKSSTTKSRGTINTASPKKTASKQAAAKKSVKKPHADYIHAWEDDPSDATPIMRPIPELNLKPFSVKIETDGHSPTPRVYPVDTPDFRYWVAAEALARGAKYWGSLLPNSRWFTGATLPVALDRGIDLNAYYDRDGLVFFTVRLTGRRSFRARVLTSFATNSDMPCSTLCAPNCGT
ncbi:MAG: hypothetical protein WKF84_16390 [Pyrinomonadaceae bacterium]